jgi:hypothetical protein
MPETLLSPSNILLYGRVLTDLEFTGLPVEPDINNPIDDEQPPDPVPNKRFPVPKAPARLGNNNFLQRQLDAGVSDPKKKPHLARIYGFSYEGHYYDLARPAIFLVHGPGNDPEAWRPDSTLPHARSDRAPADADRSGIARTATSFAEDMRVWSYDKGDFSIRLDPDSGTFEQILLQVELQTERVQTYYSGQRTRLRGSRGGMSD